MRIQIQKWGNSLALRIPKAFIQETNLEEGSSVDMGLEEDCIVIKPLRKKTFSLKKLMAEVNASNIHSEQDFGQAQGLEIW